MQKRSSRQPTKNKRFSGYLGIRTNSANTVEVAGRPGFVWVRLRNVTNEVIQAFNETTSPIYNLPVLVERDLDSPTRYRIISRDTDVYGSNWGTTSPYLAPHSAQHSWNNNDPNIGGDVTWVYQQQFTPLLVMPSGSAGAGNVLVGAGINHYGNIFSYVGSTGTANLLGYKPTGSTANLLLVYLDHETGNFGVAEGTPIANTITGTYQVVANLPAPPTGTVPLAGIRLVSGTSSIGWRNIYDVRPFFVAQTTVVGGGGGGAPTDASYVTLGLDGDLSAERVLTAGTDVTITDAGANDNVTVAVASGTFSRPGHVHNWALPVYEDETFKVTGTSLVFTDNMFVGVTGTIAYIGMTGSVGTPAANTLVVYDDSVFKVTGTAISFDDNLLVEVTGSVAYVSMTGTSSGHTIQKDGVSQTQRTNLNFIGDGFQVSDDAGNDATVVSGTHCGTYQRVAEPEPLTGVDGLYWKVPNSVFASGSLAAFQDGAILRVGYDFEEQLWVSGTYKYLSAPATGTVHMVMYGVPCYTQIQPPTGTPAPPATTGSFLLLEGGDYILLENGDKILLEGN